MIPFIGNSRKGKTKDRKWGRHGGSSCILTVEFLHANLQQHPAYIFLELI
jgi:hypothetical protein